MNRKTFRGLWISAAALAIAAPGLGATTTYTGSLSGSAENPATGSLGTGIAVVTYDSTAHTLGVNIAFSGLTGNTTASHIHCCAVPPANTGVATQTPTFAGFPLGVTSGTYNNTLDLTQASSFNAAYVTANGGTPASAEAALAAGIAAGQAYLNIHTTTNAGGEIRSFLTLAPSVSSVPALSRLGLGLFGLMVAATAFHLLHRV